MKTLLVTWTLMLTMPPLTQSQMIVAHRGASFDAPENTLAAFRLAWEQGADAIEGDFRLTRDGQIICIHDKTTKRITGVERVVAESTFDELRALDAGAWKGQQFAGEKLPTLDEVLALVPDDKAIYIEVKCGPEILPALAKSLRRRALPPGQTPAIAFDEEVVIAVRERLPDVPVYWLSSYKQNKATGAWSPRIESILATLKRTHAHGFGTKAQRGVVDAVFVRRLRDAGMWLNAWTVDEPADIRWIVDLGFDAVTTNRPGFVRDLLRRGMSEGATNGHE